MNQQSIFNKVAKHLIKQNKKSMSAGDDCMYRGANETKCAIGCLLPDRIYEKGMEYMGAGNLIEQFPQVGDYLKVTGGDDVGFLQKLQNIHDNHEIQCWKQRLRGFANRNKLKQPECIALPTN